MCQDLNLAKTQLGTNPRGQAKTHSVATEITHLVSGLKACGVSSWKEFSKRKVIGKKHIYLERLTLPRQNALKF